LHLAVIKIKGLINQRPLYRSTDREEVITPFIVLTGKHNTNTNENKQALDNIKTPKKDHYFDETSKFWHQWLINYIDTLNKIVKWTKDSKKEELKNRQVLIMNDTLHRKHWKTGNKTKAILSTDGIA
jgi:UDP-N-acetylglucosamine 2-epimerase